MEVFKKHGTKERILEMFQNVNKIKINEDLAVGTKVKVSDGSGLDSNKTGTIIDPSQIKTDMSGVPEIQGHYKPVDWSKESAVQYDDGEVNTMFNDRLMPIQEGYNEWGQKIKKSRIQEAYGEDGGYSAPYPPKPDPLNFAGTIMDLVKQKLGLDFQSVGEAGRDKSIYRFHNNNDAETFINYIKSIGGVIDKILDGGSSVIIDEKTPNNIFKNNVLNLEKELNGNQNESFDSPKEKDEKYLDKAVDSAQDNKYDDGTRYPVEEPLKVDDPSLENLKGDDIPLNKKKFVKEYVDVASLNPDQRQAFDELMSSDISMMDLRDMEYYAEKIGVDVQDLMSVLSSTGGAPKAPEGFLDDSGLGEFDPDTYDYDLGEADDQDVKCSNCGGEGIGLTMDDEKGEVWDDCPACGGKGSVSKGDDFAMESEDDQDVADNDEPINVGSDEPEGDFGGVDQIEGGLADDADVMDFDADQIAKGIKVEMEHTSDPQQALEIAMDHLMEIPDYYDHLEDMEAQAKGADGEEMVDDLGDGQEGEASEEIPDPENTEKEVLWGKMDTIGEPEDFQYEAYRLGEGKKKSKDSRLEKAGVEGYNKPKRTPNHPTKSHIVVAKEGDKVKTIRFGEQGAKTAGDPKKGESKKMKKKRKSFKARHGKNIAKGKMSAAYWADKVKW